MLVYNKQTLQFEQIENSYKKPFYFLILICFILVLSLCKSIEMLNAQNIELNIKTGERIEFEIHNLKSLQKVDSFIDILPFKDKNLIKRQYRLESGNLKSNVARKNNNLFGIKNAEKRPQLGRKSKINDYRHYENWMLSIFDRYLYELNYGTKLKNYSEDENYKKKIQEFKIK
jgi:uncharacterized FlgJ-related protein